jgi:hypothetical protein
MRSCFLVGLLIFLPATAFSQADGSAYDSYRIAVESSGDDVTGTSLVYEFKEAIRESEGHELVSSSTTPLLTVRLSTMPKSRDMPQAATMYDVVWTVPSRGKALPYFAKSTFGYAGRDTVEDAARDLMAQTDQVVSDLMDAVRRAVEEEQ